MTNNLDRSMQFVDDAMHCLRPHMGQPVDSVIVTELADFLRTFAEHTTLNMLKQLSYTFQTKEIKSLVDDMRPMHEKS